MNSALVKGFLNQGITSNEKIWVCDKSEERIEVARDLGQNNLVSEATSDYPLRHIAEMSEVLLIGTKPN